MKKNEEIKNFELNTKVLKNFDEIMSTKLNEIEELKITSLDNGSKLLNIISLCANIKTLIIDGDQTLNVEKILSNVFHPENLESLVLNNVKLPTKKVLKRYTNLNMISLNNIRFCYIKDFFKGIIKPEKLEIISVTNTDMANCSIEILKCFENLKYLSLENLLNFKIDDLKFLTKNKNLLKISIVNNAIPITQINDLLQCSCIKDIDISIINNSNKVIENCKLQIKDNINKIIFPVQKTAKIVSEIDFSNIDEMHIIIKKSISNSDYIKILKKQKTKIFILIKDYSCLSVNQAKKIREDLVVDKVIFFDNKNLKECNIDLYIDIRKQIDKIIENVSKHVDEAEKFLEIYRFLGNEFKIVEENAKYDDKTCLQEEVPKLLKNCLHCIGIKSNIIKGNDLSNDKKNSWNQVKIEDKWYNVDLAMDMEYIKKNKVKYCLLSDNKFFETHVPKSGKNNYCAENFNQKIIKVFFKTGLYRENLMKSYIELMIETIRKIFNFNKDREFLVLPSGEDNEKE